MNLKKFLTLALAFTLVLSLAACGSKGDDKTDDTTDQTMTAEELNAKIQELADKENAIMEEDLELWQKLFAAMNEKRDELARGVELWHLSARRHRTGKGSIHRR